MDTFSELIQGCKDDQTISSNSSLYTLALIKRYVNRAYRNKVCQAFRWPELEDAKKTDSEANQEYYDYPTNWQPDSIWKLKVNGIDYKDPLVFKDYLYEKENDHPSGLVNIWSSQWRRYFIDPAPTADGDQNICIWGQKVAEVLVQDADTTIFSYSLPDCNEAVVLEAVAMMKRKGKETSESQFISLEAKQLVVNAWNKIKQNQAKYENTQPMFEVPDFFAGTNRTTRRGNF